MGAMEGYMLYSCTGGTVNAIDKLPQYMIDDIGNPERLPLYKHAPKCLLDMPDETEWTYFGKHFDDYLKGGVQFPENQHTPSINV